MLFRSLPFYDYLNADISFDTELAKDVFEQIKNTDQSELESAKTDFDQLEDLAIKIAEASQLNIPKLFIYKGIREVKENSHYIIFFEVRGQGVEAPGSARVEQHHIHVSYDNNKGLIKIINKNNNNLYLALNLHRKMFAHQLRDTKNLELLIFYITLIHYINLKKDFLLYFLFRHVDLCPSG